MQLEDVLRRVEASEDDAVSMMCGMTEIPAIAPCNGGNGECARADKIQSFLKGFDTVERYDVEDPDHPGVMRANIVARRRGKKEGTVWFIAHMDVVPVGELSDWEHPPFEPLVKDGRIYGRGTEDNGQSLIGAITASKVLADQELQGMSLGAAFVGDEESGSNCGIKYLLSQGIFKDGDFIIVPDWGSPGGTMVDVSEKQLLWVKIAVTGRQTHGSTPSKGINAHRVAMEFVTDLLSKLEERYPKKDPIFRPDVSTFEPTRSVGNTGSINMIPGYHELYMDCRILPDYDIKEIVSFMGSVANIHSERTGAKIDVTVEQGVVSGKPSDPDTDNYRTFVGSIKQARGIDVSAVGIGGGTCANFFRLAGMNAYVWGSDGGTLHQPNEYVVIRTMMDDAKAFAAIMYNMCVKG